MIGAPLIFMPIQCVCSLYSTRSMCVSSSISSEEPPTISKETEPRTTPKKKVLMINTHFHTLNIYKYFLSIKEKKSKKKKK